MTRNPDRPLSPHLTIWRWGPGMLVSILHRITGGALAVAGLGLLTWWLWAIAERRRRPMTSFAERRAVTRSGWSSWSG